MLQQNNIVSEDLPLGIEIFRRLLDVELVKHISPLNCDVIEVAVDTYKSQNLDNDIPHSNTRGVQGDIPDVQFSHKFLLITSDFYQVKYKAVEGCKWEYARKNDNPCQLE